MVLVLKKVCWDVVDILAKYSGSSFLEKLIALSRFKRFDYEYREADEIEVLF
jgi:hypothetical protein